MGVRERSVIATREMKEERLKGKGLPETYMASSLTPRPEPRLLHLRSSGAASPGAHTRSIYDGQSGRYQEKYKAPSRSI